MSESLPATTEKLIGSWKLIGVSSTTSTGDKIGAPYGENPSGILTYTVDGRMSSVISYGGRKPLPPAGGSTEDLAEAFKTFFAYAGLFTLREDEVVHHIEVSSIQNHVGRDLIRRIKFEGDRITLTTPPGPVNGKIQTVELVWQRQTSKL